MNGTAISMPQQAVPLPQLFNPNVKDSRWLTLEVCREYTRNKCTRTDQECKFAHPPPHVEVQNGRVTCCFDSIKGKCQRKDPPCKYLHPPQHLKEQLLQNGRNNLILRNLQWQALTSGLQPVVPQPMPTVVYDTSPGSSKAAAAAAGVGSAYPSTSPLLQAATQYPANFFGPPGYIMGNPAGAAVNAAGMNPYVSSQAGLTNIIQNIDGLGMTSLPVSLSGSASQLPSAMVTTPTSVAAAQKVARADRLESVNPVPGMVPIVKRTAMDAKGGMAMYPSAGASATYQQALAAMQMQQQQQYVPVTIAGHPPGVPRF